MFQDFQDAMVLALQGQQAVGKHLAAIELVQKGDTKPPAQYRRVCTLDWDNKTKGLKKVGNGYQPVALFALSTYASHPIGEVQADIDLQNLLWREQSGKIAGVIPFLMAQQAVRGASGRWYGWDILPQMPRGILPGKGIFRVVSYVLLEVYPKPITDDDILPL